MDVHEEGISLPGEARVIRAPHLAVVRVVDRVSVQRHPVTDLAEYPHRRLGDRTVAARTDVEQIIPPLPGTGNQIPNYLPGGFPVIIRGLVSPAVVQRHAS